MVIESEKVGVCALESSDEELIEWEYLSIWFGSCTRRDKCLRSRFQRWYSYRGGQAQEWCLRWWERDLWLRSLGLLTEPGARWFTQVEIILATKFSDDFGAQNGGGKSIVWRPLSFTWFTWFNSLDSLHIKFHFCVTKSIILFPFHPHSLGLWILYFPSSFLFFQNKF